jgi:hypothetical protein
MKRSEAFSDLFDTSLVLFYTGLQRRLDLGLLPRRSKIGSMRQVPPREWRGENTLLILRDKA